MATKRTATGQLVTELQWHEVEALLDQHFKTRAVGAAINIDGVQHTIASIGARFKRNGYAYAYVYLVEDAPAAAAAVATPADLSIEDLEDMGEFGEALKRAHIGGTPS